MISKNYVPSATRHQQAYLALGALCITFSLICLFAPVLFPMMGSKEAVFMALGLSPLCSVAGLVCIFCGRS